MQNTKKVRPQLCWWSWAALTGGHRQYMQTQAVQAGTCIISRCRQYRWAHAVYLSECSIGERRQYRQAQAVQVRVVLRGNMKIQGRSWKKDDEHKQESKAPIE